MTQRRAVALPMAAAALTILTALMLCPGVFTPPRPPGASAHPAAAPAKPAATVVALGDSVAVGGACNCDPYPTRVTRHLNAQRSSPLTVSNLAVSGSETADVLDELRESSTRRVVSRARYVLIEIGANDFSERDLTDRDCLGSGLPCQQPQLQRVAANLDSIVSQVHALAPRRTTVVLLGYWNVFKDGRVAAALGPTYVDQSAKLTRAVNRIVAGVADAHQDLYVDTVAPFKGPRGHRDATDLLAPDGDHPNSAGQQALADAILADLGYPNNK